MDHPAAKRRRRRRRRIDEALPPSSSTSVKRDWPLPASASHSQSLQDATSYKRRLGKKGNACISPEKSLWKVREVPWSRASLSEFFSGNVDDKTFSNLRIIPQTKQQIWGKLIYRSRVSFLFIPPRLESYCGKQIRENRVKRNFSFYMRFLFLGVPGVRISRIFEEREKRLSLSTCVGDQISDGPL